MDEQWLMDLKRKLSLYRYCPDEWAQYQSVAPAQSGEDAESGWTLKDKICIGKTLWSNPKT